MSKLTLTLRLGGGQGSLCVYCSREGNLELLVKIMKMATLALCLNP